VDIPCEVSVLITNDDGIQKINREFRGIDNPTDVLSFPMQDFSSPGWSFVDAEMIEHLTGHLPLGDIILSAQRVETQARENAQSREQETAYLTIHAVLHLLGYDHIDEAEGKKQMRMREKAVLKEVGVGAL
jgi:probable rRNA maturation factor